MKMTRVIILIYLLVLYVSLSACKGNASSAINDVRSELKDNDAAAAAVASKVKTTSIGGKPKIDAVMLTTGKDTRVFEKSITSALLHLIDVDKFYIISPNAVELGKKLGHNLGKRVIFVEEESFPFNASVVADVMVDTVKQKGIYPLEDGKSTFERTLWGKLGWFLQQILKIYAGVVLKLDDYVLLDSDLVWFNNVSFIANYSDTGVRTYYYATSNQYHPPYVASLKRIAGVGLLPNQPFHRSGIVHHMVIVKTVMEDLFKISEALHGGIPFWQVLLNVSALEMTCRAPKTPICGAGSTLSEYELYFNFARNKHPETVALKPLLWANGPLPGLLFWPESGKIESDGPKRNWRGHRQAEVMEVLEKTINSDRQSGFDYVGYHGYAKRRYFELLDPDIEKLCVGVTDSPLKYNSTCSYNGFETSGRTFEQWFGGCACYMVNHQSGP